ncbi:MAG: DNA repair protein RecO [Gordonibacter pamelaeae]
MASATYTARAIVLRKTKLGESDLIVTLLAQDGSQVRAVAKGARKPSSPFAARLELYSSVDLLCSEGRSLDIVKEARIASSNERLRRDLEHAACAAPMAELLDRVTQEGLANPRLFALTEAALDALDGALAPQAPAVCAAHLLKALAFSGLRPSLSSCAVCGADVPGGADAGTWCPCPSARAASCAPPAARPWRPRACRPRPWPGAGRSWGRRSPRSQSSTSPRPRRSPCCASASSGRTSTWVRT